MVASLVEGLPLLTTTWNSRVKHHHKTNYQWIGEWESKDSFSLSLSLFYSLSLAFIFCSSIFWSGLGQTWLQTLAKSLKTIDCFSVVHFIPGIKPYTSAKEPCSCCIVMLIHHVEMHWWTPIALNSLKVALLEIFISQCVFVFLCIYISLGYCTIQL